jgi:uncharacterized SAM-dependent methyltransferase
LQFKIEAGTGGLKRIAAHVVFTRAARVAIELEQFDFRRGESIRLFFSYRYTPALVRKLLGKHGLEVSGEWVAKSGEEGVFLCRKK